MRRLGHPWRATSHGFLRADLGTGDGAVVATLVALEPGSPDPVRVALGNSRGYVLHRAGHPDLASALADLDRVVSARREEAERCRKRQPARPRPPLTRRAFEQRMSREPWGDAKGRAATAVPARRFPCRLCGEPGEVRVWAVRRSAPRRHHALLRIACRACPTLDWREACPCGGEFGPWDKPHPWSSELRYERRFCRGCGGAEVGWSGWVGPYERAGQPHREELPPGYGDAYFETVDGAPNPMPRPPRPPVTIDEGL